MLDQTRRLSFPAVYLHSEARTMGELFRKRVQRDRDRVAFRRKRNGEWLPTTWGQFHDRAAAIASMLIASGLEVGDKVCIIGSTGPEWCYADIGGHLAGAVTLGAYPTLPPADLAYVLDHSDTRVAFAEGATQVRKLLAIRDQIPKVERVLVWNCDDMAQEIADHDGASDWLISLDEVLAHDIATEPIIERIAAVDPAHTAIIVYTSGTTGPPKGAMISHRNILAMLAALEPSSNFEQDDVSFLFLPMAHVAERVASFYGRISSGIQGAFASDIASVLEEMQEVQPTLFGSVPRIFEKAYARIMGQVNKAPPARQKVFRWATRTGRQVVAHWQAGTPVPWPMRAQFMLADRMVFSKIRNVFGGRVAQFVTGAAPISHEILEFFWAAGFPIFEVYGMTESTTISHVNKPGQVRLGSVGRKIDTIEERIADDGEILVRGPTVFLGYYKNPEATAETIDADGWLHTGDIGRIDDDGYLYIVDRKKHIIITAGGKNLTPANIENVIKSADPIISQAHVHGDKRPYLTAIITIGPSDALEYARERGWISEPDAQRMSAAFTENPLARPEGLAELMHTVTTNDELRERIARAVRQANSRLAKVETIKKVHLLERDFSMDEDELTPTLKIKRKNIEKKFSEQVFDRLYQEPSFGIVIEAKT